MNMKDWYSKAVFPYKTEKGTHTTGLKKFLIINRFVLNIFNRTDKIIIADLGGVNFTYRNFKKLLPNSVIYSVNLVKEHINKVENSVVADVLKTPLKSNSIDMVFSGDTIEHIIDTDKFVEEIYRILKPNGYLILTTPNLCDWLNRIFILLGLSPHNYNPSAYKFGNPFFRGKGVWHKSVFTPRGLIEFLESYNFKILKIDGFTYIDKKTKNLKTFRKIVNAILPNSWKEGICVLAQKI